MWLILMCIVTMNGDLTFEECSPIDWFEKEDTCQMMLDRYHEDEADYESHFCVYDDEAPYNK